MKFVKTDNDRRETTVEMTSASRSNKFNVLNLTERGLEVEEQRTGRPGCRSKCWQMKINAMNLVKFVKIDVMGSVKFVKIVMKETRDWNSFGTAGCAT